MHWTLATTCVLIVWAMAAGPWRLGSIALAASWMIAQAWYCWSGESVPLLLYHLLDAVVIAAVLNWRGSWLDWIILALFPLEWWVYGQMTGTPQWWALWGLSSLQFVAAGPWPQVQRMWHTVSHGPLYPLDRRPSTRYDVNGT